MATNKQQTTKLFNIYGAKTSKAGKHLVISLVTGTDDNKEYANLVVPIDKTFADKKTKDIVWIPVKRLTEKKEDSSDEKVPF